MSSLVWKSPRRQIIKNYQACSSKPMFTKSVNKSLLIPVSLLVLLSGCGSVSVWNPFASDKPQSQSGAPSNAIEYQCDAGKKFYVRLMDNGNTAWLIYPDREFGLNKAAGGPGARYTNGIAVLNINGNEASLNDGPAIAYTGCKAAGK